jgi:hypothetical protein
MFRLMANLGLLGCATVVLIAAQQPPPQARRSQFSGRAVQATHHDVSRALRDLPPNPDAAEGNEKAAHAPKHVPRRPHAQPGFRDPAVQLSIPAPLLASPTTSFDGVNNRDSVLPPDVNGDVGPNHYVQWVNLSYAVYNKSGTRLAGPLSGNQLFSGFSGTACATSNDGDPIALYDELADRWMLSQFALPNYPSGPFYQCIAVSQTGDPAGAYYRYQFKISDTKLNDYPKFGVWPTGYFMSVNQFSGNTFSGAGVVAFERDKMLQGLSARMYYVDTNDASLGGMLPSDLDGTPPAAGTANFFMQFDDVPAQLEVWRFDVTWGTSVTGSFTHATDLAVSSFDSNMCNYGRNCIPQAGTSRKLDAISDRLMYRLQYRNFGTYETFVTNHTVDVDGTDHAGVRWYEVRRTNGTFAVRQQGTWAPDAVHRWMASAAMDTAGNLALAFNASSSTVYPSIRYAARVAGDALGTMGQGEADILVGSGFQTSSASRWGDYSNLSVAPDGCTFWATLEYSDPSTPFKTAPWRTRIAAFTLPGCTGTVSPPTAPGNLNATPGPSGVALTWTDASGETGYNIERCQGSGCTPSTITTVGANVVSYTDGTAVPSSNPYTYRVTATNSGGSASSGTVTVTVTATVAAPTNLTATALKSGGIRLNWIDHASDETRFEIQRTGGSGAASFTVNGTNVATYTDSTTAARTNYTYQVRACNAATCSAWSNSASARAR